MNPLLLNRAVLLGRHFHLTREASTIYIDRVKESPLSGTRRKRLLVVLFIPSVERNGTTPIAQDQWVLQALELFGRVFGGATAYPKAQGVWRDDENDRKLVKDNPVILHCYMAPEDIENTDNQASLGEFCRNMGRETNQGEVGLVIGDEYLAITNFRKG